MGHQWIINVLADLRAFAQTNGMPQLAAGLDDVARQAIVEIGVSGERAPLRVVGDDTETRFIPRAVGAGRRA
jgi:hypothetical protein